MAEPYLESWRRANPDAPPGLLDVWEPPIDVGEWPGFAVALDGRVRAAADPLGAWWEWRADERPHPS